MQALAPQAAGAVAPALRGISSASGAPSAYVGHQIIRRNGAVVGFEPNKIAVALMKAFLAVHGTQGAASASVRETVDGLSVTVVRALLRSRPGGGTCQIEDVQDQVELGLMRGGHREVARASVVFRVRRARERAQQAAPAPARVAEMHVVDNGQRVPLDAAALHALVESACTLANEILDRFYIVIGCRFNRFDAFSIGAGKIVDDAIQAIHACRAQFFEFVNCGRLGQGLHPANFDQDAKTNQAERLVSAVGEYRVG
jgi:ribonucleoside-diphosphate reductase alpha chain